MANDEHVAIARLAVGALAQWREENPETQLDLTGADLTEADLREADFRRADLTGADLTEADLREADFTEANLHKADLIGADLTEANLHKANLIGANLHKATLIGADLTEANLTEANLREAHLTGADLTEADLTEANLREAELTEANLIGADLTEANLHKANLHEAILIGAILREADFRRADLTGAELTEADLTEADLTEADLTEADLIEANFLRADLTEANLVEIMFANATGQGANLTHATLHDAVFTTQDESTPDRSFLELAACDGLETARFADPTFLGTYIAEAFAYVHQDNLEEAEHYPDFVAKALANIKLLRGLYTESETPPPELVQVVHDITAELIKYLKTHPKALYTLQPRQFEELVAEVLAHYGWTVQLTPASKDGGYDIFAISKDIAGVETAWLIECKKYAPDRKVGVDIARALFGVKQDLQVANAMLATTSHFTAGVNKYKASRYDLALRDYEGLLEWINEYKPNPNGRLYIKDHQLKLPGEKDYR